MKARLALALLMPVIACALQWLLWDYIKPYVWFLFFPAAFFSARVGGLAGGLAGTVLGALLVWYVFIPPRFSFALEQPASAFSIAMFLLMGCLFAWFHERLRRALASAEGRFEATFEQAAVGFVQMRPDGRFLRVNRAMCQLFGWNQAELLAKTFRDVTHPGDLSESVEQVRRMLAGEIPSFSMEKRYLRADGDPFWGKVSASVVLKSDGTPDYMIAVVEDISDRRQSEEAERESQERLQLFIEHAPASLAMFDSDMRYLAVSRRWRDDYGLGGRDIVGQSHYDVFPEIADAWKSVHRRALWGEVVRADKDRFERSDGKVQWLRWEVRPWYAADGAVGGIVIFSEDISRYQEAQEEIHRLNADLERRVEERTAELSAANRELDAFAYAVSHDLRAPLRAMSGFSRALEEDYGALLEGQGKEYLDQIVLASGKMAELIDGILTLSRSTRSELRRDEVDISALAGRLLDELARGEPGRTVTVSVADGLLARGDARMLEAVLRNLLDNAWKYTGRQGDAKIRVFREERDGQGWFCVSDNGAGFDMAHAARLFQPFQRLHRQDEFPGLGIGLATVQRIIHRHGGRIEARAEVGQGATFCFTLAGEKENHGSENTP